MYYMALFRNFPGQVRGIPAFASIIHELSKITDAEIFELETAAVNASIAAALIRKKEVTDMDKLSRLGKPGWAGMGQEDNNTSVEPLYQRLQFEERKIGRGGFILQNLEPNEEIKEYDTKRPNLNIPNFIESIMAYAAPSCGISSEVVKMLFGQSYSASKAGIELTWRNLDVLIANFSSDFEQIIFEYWMLGEIARGRIIAPGFNEIEKRAAWTQAEWVGLPIPALNPAQEASASEILLRNGLTSHEHEAQRRTGTNFDSNVERLIRENAELKIALDNLGGGNNNGQNNN